MTHFGFVARVRNFASIAILNQLCKELDNVDIDVQQGRYIVDGKSILGLHSIDLFSDFVMVFVSHANFTESEISKIENIRNIFGE